MAENRPTTIATKPITEIRNVGHTFALPGGRELQVLEHINLEIFDGEIVALLGPSGCGKSTLLRILAGLLEPAGGQVLYRGQEIHSVNPAVSVVFQSLGLFPWLTAWDNIDEVLRATGLNKHEREKRIKQVVDLIGLEGFEDLYPRELSGGMKQRVGIARALVVEPEILCLDEPFTQVDALTAENLRAELLNLWLDADRNPKTIFIVSHDIREVVWLATRIVVLGDHPGKILSIVRNTLPYPRDFRDPRLGTLQERIHELLTTRIMPDEAPQPNVPGVEIPSDVEAIPAVDASQIMGLLEMLDDRGGEVNIFAFSNELKVEFGKAISVAKAAEMLEFVETPRQRVLLLPLGRELLKADMNDRKTIWGQQLLKIRLFHIFKSMVDLADPNGIPRETIIDEIDTLLPTENPEVIFDVLISWGQYGELFRFDHDADELMPFEADEDDDSVDDSVDQTPDEREHPDGEPDPGSQAT